MDNENKCFINHPAPPKPDFPDEDSLVEITDKVQLRAYLEPFPEFPEDYAGNKNWVPVILRITDPTGEKSFDLGLSLGPILSKNVADCFDVYGIRKEEKTCCD